MYDVREAESRSLSVHPYSRHDADAFRRCAQGSTEVRQEDQGDAVHGRREQKEHGEDDRPDRQAAGQDQNVSVEGFSYKLEFNLFLEVEPNLDMKWCFIADSIKDLC